MKKRSLLFLLLLIVPVRADNASSQALNIGASKVVILPGTTSPDHFYAIGWTVVLKNNAAPPVDWLQWSPDKSEAFFDKYNKGDYQVEDCFVDFQHKERLPLWSKEPDFPTKNRGNIAVAWGPENKPTRYALVQNDGRFATENLWLVTFSPNGMGEVDLASDCAKAVFVVLREKRPLTFPTFETLFSLDGDVPAQFNGDSADFAFTSDIPKSQLENSTVEGRVTVHLPDAKVVSALSSTPRDDPFHDFPALITADRQLNETYARLSSRISPADRAKLKEEQITWIATVRDADAGAAENQAIADNTKDPIEARNKMLVDDTKKRTAELQARMN